MKIVGKSGCYSNQLNDRYLKGFRNIEIQLLSDFLSDDLDLDSYFETIISSKLNVEAIHIPLMENSDDVNLEYISDPKLYKAFFNYCSLAQRCSEYFGHDVTIVVHNNLNLETYLHIPILFDHIKETFKKALKEFPNITFSLENLLAVLFRKDSFQIRNFSFYENVELTNYFNNHFNTDRFYTTLDICHMLSSLKTINNYKDEDYYNNFIFSIEEFFKQNKDTINNIHLNFIKNYGFSKGEHGPAFKKENTEDENMLRYLLDLYIKYNYSCNITIEVYDPDLNKVINSENLRIWLCELLKEYKIT